MKISCRIRDNIAGYLFILPNLVGFVVFIAFAVLFSFYMSFTDWDMLSDISDVNFIGLKNYINIFKDKWFIDSIINNVFFIAFIPLQMVLALICAVALGRDMPGMKIVRGMFYLPYITSFVAVALIFFQLFQPTDGLINNVLRSFGITNPPLWFGSSFWVKPAIVLLLTWKSLGYNMILYLAGLQGIPKQLYEAADVDGATGLKRFYYITIPLISPVSFFILIMSVIGSFKMWSAIQILTEGGPGSSSTVIGYYIYKNAFEFSKMGYASSIAWILFFIILIVTLVQWRGQKKWVNYL